MTPPIEWQRARVTWHRGRDGLPVKVITCDGCGWQFLGDTDYRRHLKDHDLWKVDSKRHDGRRQHTRRTR